jgi:hypothetical protein
MNSSRITTLALAALLGTGLPALAQSPKSSPRRPAPVSVSSVNYANTPREELYRLEAEKLKANPATPTLQPLASPQRYVFLPGELYETDIPYEEMCARLAETLAKKGFVNAVDQQGRVIQPDKVDLILRVHGGERLWLNPTVRMDQLTWRDGLVARPRGRTLTTLGGEVKWDSRAGGNDSALGAMAANENSPGFGFGSSPATPGAGAPELAGGASQQAMTMAAPGEYDATREYYLIVVDAFNYTELKEKGDRAKRQWTTFVAAPRQPGQKFSDVLDTMLRVATPYFGENTAGLQMYNDARATVTIRELEVLESGVKAGSGK